MATPTSQRIGIWFIAIVLAMGTFGSFLVMGLDVKNQTIEQEDLQKAYVKYQKDVSDQAKSLSDKYYAEFSSYTSLVSEFTASDVTALAKEDIKVGDGVEIKSDTEYSAYYIGWNPKGVVFDQSISDGTLKAPISSGNLIAGWNEGVVGMKMGGVRLLTIPSDKAYGSKGSGDDIPPNTPLKFVVMIIPKVEAVTMPDILVRYYMSQS